MNSEHVEYRVIVIVIPDIVLVVMKIAKVLRYTALFITLCHPDIRISIHSDKQLNAYTNPFNTNI